MKWEPGESGNPNGAPRKEKRFGSMLERVSVQEEYKRLRQSVEKLLDAAAGGDSWAIQMLADRFDGKAPQSTEVDITVHDGIVSGEPLTPEQWEATHDPSDMGAAAGAATRPH